MNCILSLRNLWISGKVIEFNKESLFASLTGKRNLIEPMDTTNANTNAMSWLVSHMNNMEFIYEAKDGE